MRACLLGRKDLLGMNNIQSSSRSKFYSSLFDYAYELEYGCVLIMFIVFELVLSLVLCSWYVHHCSSLFIRLVWLGFVDTVFGHISFDVYLELIKNRSADEATVTSLKGSCRWRWLPMRKLLNKTKSRGGDVFVPMISISVCRWPQQMICRWL